MPSRRLSTCLTALLVVGSFVVSGASPVRVATLGGDSRLVLDATNLHQHPALTRQLAHVHVELFDEWASVAVPLGSRHAVGLFLNRPDPRRTELAAYLQSAGSNVLASLEPSPWLDMSYAIQWTPSLALGLSLRTLYDVRDLGATEAEAGLWEGRVGLSAGRGRRGLDVTIGYESVNLRDATTGTQRQESDSGGPSVEARKRLPIGETGMLLSSLTWRRVAFGLHPETYRIEERRASVAVNIRPQPQVMGLAGLVVAQRIERTNTIGDGFSAHERESWLLPAIVAGGEAQVGGIVLRLGLRQEHAIHKEAGPVIADLRYSSAFAADVGLGFEAGRFSLDGHLETDFLRDGPHILGGSRRGGGLLSTLSLQYRLYR